jgi:hypothetical protein
MTAIVVRFIDADLTEIITAPMVARQFDSIILRAVKSIAIGPARATSPPTYFHGDRSGLRMQKGAPVGRALM